jgi:xeroderma pigmentosum group C-complementing protein
MAGSRGRLRKTTAQATPRRSTRRTRSSQQDEGVPEVFQEMLREEQATQATSTDDEGRPLKKRKTAPSQRTSSPVLSSSPAKPAPDQARKAPPAPPAPRAKAPAQLPLSSSVHSESSNVHESEVPDVAPANERFRQTVIDSDESDGSDEEWEDALADGDDTDGHEEVDLVTPQVADISITKIPPRSGGSADEPSHQWTRRSVCTFTRCTSCVCSTTCIVEIPGATI